MSSEPVYVEHLLARWPLIGAYVFTDLMLRRRVPEPVRMFHLLDLWRTGSGRVGHELVKVTPYIVGQNVLALLYAANRIEAARGRGRAYKKAFTRAIDRVPQEALEEYLDWEGLGPVTVRRLIFRLIPRGRDEARAEWYSEVIAETREYGLY